MWHCLSFPSISFPSISNRSKSISIAKFDTCYNTHAFDFIMTPFIFKIQCRNFSWLWARLKHLFKMRALSLSSCQCCFSNCQIRHETLQMLTCNRLYWIVLTWLSNCLLCYRRWWQLTWEVHATKKTRFVNWSRSTKLTYEELRFFICSSSLWGQNRVGEVVWDLQFGPLELVAVQAKEL